MVRKLRAAKFTYTISTDTRNCPGKPQQEVTCHPDRL